MPETRKLCSILICSPPNHVRDKFLANNFQSAERIQSSTNQCGATNCSSIDFLGIINRQLINPTITFELLFLWAVLNIRAGKVERSRNQYRIPAASIPLHINTVSQRRIFFWRGYKSIASAEWISFLERSCSWHGNNLNGGKKSIRAFKRRGRNSFSMHPRRFPRGHYGFSRKIDTFLIEFPVDFHG